MLSDDWMAIYMGGTKIGHLHTEYIERSAPEGVLHVTRLVEQMSLKAGTAVLTIRVRQQIVEDADGRLVSFFHSMEQPGMSSPPTRGEVKDGRLSITTGQGPNAQRKAVELPKGLCPQAFDRETQSRGFAPGTQYSLPVFLAESPEQAWTASVEVVGKEAVPLFEVQKWLNRIEVKVSMLGALNQVYWTDDEGEIWLVRVSMGTIDIEMRKVSREVALSSGGAADLMMRVAVRPDRPISNPRGRDSLTLLLKPTGKAPEDRTLPSDAFQEVTERADGLLVTVRKAVGDPSKSYTLPYGGEEWADLLEPTAWLESGDPLIVQMSKEAVGGETDALKAAQRIELYVRRVLAKKWLGMGFATALETARQRAGDCTEHAVLCAALARAAGIPSRVVMGMGYADASSQFGAGQFLYHMWTEVYVGEWLPVDAAMLGHDATHIALGRSNLDSPGAMVEVSGPAMAFLGSTAIQVVEPGSPAQP